MIIKRRLSQSSSGFTIVELMIATVVFSVILLVCTFAMLQIGRTYYKGVTMSKTQNVARTIIDDVSQSIQFSGGAVKDTPSGPTQSYFCLGDKRYTYELGEKLQDNGTNHALVQDETATCAQYTGGGAPWPPGKELLGVNMRLGKLSVAPEASGSSLYKITVRVIYGDDEVLDNVADLANTKCRSNSSGGQFCAISELSTVVQKRL